MVQCPKLAYDQSQAKIFGSLSGRVQLCGWSLPHESAAGLHLLGLGALGSLAQMSSQRKLGLH